MAIAAGSTPSSSPGSAASSVETAELMFGCLKRLGRLLDVELSGCGLSLSRMKLLSDLCGNGPQHQSELATRLRLAPRTVTELVDGLERDGLVQRQTDPADRRARQVHLTAAGGRANTRAVAVRERVVGRVLSTLDDERQAELAAALRLIQAELDTIDGLGANGDASPTTCAS